MSDEIDRANETAEFNLQVALANRPHASHKPSRQFCENCGNPIPPERREAVPGVELCVDCANKEERREKLGR